MDAEGNLRGLITIKDIEKAQKYPFSAKDENGRLLCGAAVGVTHDVFDRIDALLAAKVDVINIEMRSHTGTDAMNDRIEFFVLFDLGNSCPFRI